MIEPGHALLAHRDPAHHAQGSGRHAYSAEHPVLEEVVKVGPAHPKADVSRVCERAKASERTKRPRPCSEPG